MTHRSRLAGAAPGLLGGGFRMLGQNPAPAFRGQRGLQRRHNLGRRGINLGGRHALPEQPAAIGRLQAGDTTGRPLRQALLGNQFKTTMDQRADGRFQRAATRRLIKRHRVVSRTQTARRILQRGRQADFDQAHQRRNKCRRIECTERRYRGLFTRRRRDTNRLRDARRYRLVFHVRKY